jgi:hypothetical protein
MIDPHTLPALWRRVVETTTTVELLPHDGPVLARFTSGEWRLYSCTAQFPSLNSIDAYRVVNPDGTTGPMVERETATTRAWTATPPNDETEVRVLWSDGQVILDRGKDCQSLWQGTAHLAHEIGWTTLDEWAAFLAQPTQCVEVTEADVRSVLCLDGSAGRIAAELNARLRARVEATV